MDNKLFDLEIPTERLDQTIKNSIARGEKYKNKIKLKKVAAACFLVGGISIFNIAQPVFAENIPIIGTVFQKVNNTLGINKNSKDYVKYAQNINKSSEDKNIKIKVTDAILDDYNNLILCYEIKNENGFSTKDKKILENTIAGINLGGIKRVSFQPNYNMVPEKVEKVLPSLSKDGEMLTLQESNGGIVGEFIDDNTFIGKSEYNLSSFKNIPNNFKIKFDINKIDFSFGSTVKSNKENFNIFTPLNTVEGKWNLEFTVAKSEIKETKTVKTNISSENIMVNDITITPFTTDISAKVDFSKVNKLKVVDENNREYTSYNTINKKETDSKFTEIIFRFTDINKDIKKLKLIFLDGNNKEVFSCSVPIS